jgi:hypothetical protein
MVPAASYFSRVGMPSVSSRPVMILACAIPDAAKTTLHGSSAMISPFYQYHCAGSPIAFISKAEHPYFRRTFFLTQYVVVQKDTDTFCCIFSLQIRFYLLNEPEMLKQLKAHPR